MANWWIASAVTGHTKSRDITRLGEKNAQGNYPHIQLTDEEKVADALNVAKNHVENYRVICDNAVSNNLIKP